MPDRRLPKKDGKGMLREHSVARFLSRHWIVIIGLLALCQFLFAVDDVFFFHGGDNAKYISLARSLIAGHGYTDINTYPAGPHVKYPFMFPLLIAAVMSVFGENILAVRVMIALFASITAVAAGLLWKDRGAGLIAVLTALLVSTSPYLLNYSVDIYSEIPFTAFSCLTLVFAERALKKDSALSPEIIFCALFLILAYFTRSIGIALAPALALAAFLTPPARERLKRNAVLAGVMVLPCAAAGLAWHLRGQILTGGGGRDYLAVFLQKEKYIRDSGIVGLYDLVDRVVTNCNYYLEQCGVTPWPFFHSPPPDKMFFGGALLVSISLLGFVRSIRHRRGAPELYLLSYLALMLSWGFKQSRFFIPLFPLLIYYLLMGLEGVISLGARLTTTSGKARTMNVAISLIAIIIVGINLSSNFKFLRLVSQSRDVKGFEINPWFRIMAMDEGMANLLAASVHLRDNSEPGAVVFARKPNLVALASDRPAVGGPFARNPSDFVSDLEKFRVRYIVTDETFDENIKYILPAVSVHADRFEPFFRVGWSRCFVYKFSSGNTK
jgi:4-amino-4-deoxy-L-arabinose transferase-like glycosyltransferase